MSVETFRRAVFVSTFFLALTAMPAVAQTHTSTLSDLRGQLARGDVVSLIRTDGGLFTGRLLRFASDEIEIEAEQSGRRITLTLPFDAIRSLERLPDSARNGALIGAGIAGGAMGGLFLYAWKIDANEMDEWAPIYLKYGLAFSGLGALIGWIVDAHRAKPYVRYDAPVAQALRMNLVPLLTSQHRGIGMSVSF